MLQVPGQKGSSSSERIEQNLNLSTLLADAESTAEIVVITTDSLVKHVARMISVAEDKLDVNKPMHAYGVDSLVAVDLRNWVAKSFDVDVTVFDILGGTSFVGLGHLVAKKYKERHESTGEEES